jgi:hypothetical protein
MENNEAKKKADEAANSNCKSNKVEHGHRVVGRWHTRNGASSDTPQ